MKRPLFVALFLALGASCALTSLTTHAQAAGVAPPSPPPLTVAPTAPPASPNPSASPGDNRTGIDGVWEVQIQTSDETIYDHFKLAQKENVLTGFFLDNQHNNKKYPAAGSVDGKNVRLVVTKDDGTTMIFTGTVSGTTDMIGLLQQGTQTIAFTAAYRPKYKWLDSINPTGGMLGGGNGSPP